MAKYIWRKISVWFWKETVRWTAVSATSWFPQTTIDFDEKFENVIQEGALWNIVDSNESFNTKRWAEWSIEGDLQIENSWLLFLWLLWQITSVETAWTWAYDHTYTLLNSNQHPSLTIVTEEDNGNTSFWLWMIEELTLSWNIWEIVKLKVTFKSKAWVTTTATADFIDNDNTLLTRHWLFKVDSIDIPFKNFSITFKKNLIDDFTWWDIDIHDILNQQFEITWNIEFDYDSNTFKNYALNNEIKPISILIQNSDVTIWVNDSPTLSIELLKCSFTNWDRNKTNNEIVNQTIDFKWHYDITTWSIWSILLRNTTASY